MIAKTAFCSGWRTLGHGRRPHTLTAAASTRLILRTLAALAILGACVMHVTSSVAAPTVSTPSDSPQLQKCLKRADDLPDMASAEATAWIKRGGGNDAHLCRAFAQSNRGMHPDAAREFWFLASFYDKHDPPRGLLLHNLSGQEFFRAKDHKNAEAQYTAALKIDAGDVAAHIGRAEVRSAEEKYWDALDDLNRALKVQPENVDALRQRGRAWMQLGNDKNAQDDLEHAEALTEPDAAK